MQEGKLPENVWKRSVLGQLHTARGRITAAPAVRPGDDIVVTKWIGLEGTARIARLRERELAQRYPFHMIEEAQKFAQYLSVLPETEVAARSGAGAMYDVSEGGIFGALWELAEASGVGLEIDFKKIPIRQETVEICEFFGLNPYQLTSGGSLLAAAADGKALVNELEKAGIPAVSVGRATAGNDRVLVNGEKRRFLEPPRTDEIYKILHIQEEESCEKKF